MIFVVFVAFSLVTGATTARGGHTYNETQRSPLDHDRTTANSSSASIHHGETPLVLATASNQTVRGNTSLDPGTKLSIQVHATEQFFMSQSVTVRPNGTFAATFNFTEYEPGTKFGVIVGRPRNNSSIIEPLTVVDGVLQNETKEIVDRSTSTDTVTRTMTRGNVTNESSTRDASDAAENSKTTHTKIRTTTTERSTTGSDGQPGFGIAVALLALAAIVFVHRNG